MIPWSHLDTAQIPGGGDLRLMQRGSEFSIMLGSNTLMNSRLSGSEEALASLAYARIQSRARPRLLIGGLGMGFTLRAALAEVGPDAEITVAELVPAVVTWARGPMKAVFGTCLDDPRVTIRETDVGALIESGRAAYDAILLDVDNGPDGITRQSNDGLYGLRGLKATHEALSPGGVLAVWSSGPDQGFVQRMGKTGFVANEIRARANGKRGGMRHIIWIATKVAR